MNFLVSVNWYLRDSVAASRTFGAYSFFFIVLLIFYIFSFWCVFEPVRRVNNNLGYCVSRLRKLVTIDTIVFAHYATLNTRRQIIHYYYFVVTSHRIVLHFCLNDMCLAICVTFFFSTNDFVGHPKKGVIS